uniref:SAGA complex associated factor 29 n=1 Tax=Fundulus heteroclitus TaxID=8078 RepID=A0A3Q2Q2B5_FUNHE
MSADTKIAELLTELHQLIKQTQEERSRSEHNLLNIQKTHERMQTENKTSPYYRTKLRGLYTTAKADAEAECRRHTLSRRRIIPLPQWKANPETDPEALFSKDQLVLALYPQTTCFYRALIHTPPHRVSGSARPARVRSLAPGRPAEVFTPLASTRWPVSGADGAVQNRRYRPLL